MMEAIWATGLMILTVLVGSVLAGDGPCSPTRFWADSTGQRWNMGYKVQARIRRNSHSPTGEPWDANDEISGKVLRICAGGIPRFPEAEYRRYREANP